MTGRIISVDPGTDESAYCIMDSPTAFRCAKVTNSELLHSLRTEWSVMNYSLAIEGIASMGMAVGAEVFRTCYLIGQMMEAWQARGGAHRLVYRKEVKLFHCETVKASDANIRAALIDRYGPGKDRAVGTKSDPGPLYGIKGDCWSALAIAICAEGTPTDAPLFRHPQPAARPVEPDKPPF